MKMKKSKIMVIVSIFVIFVFACLYWVNTPYRDARTLVAAIRNEDTEKVEELLQHGVDPNVLTASKLGSKLLGFVEMGPDRPLSEACRMGNIDIVKALIGHGATAEPMDGTGWSPLDETLFFYQPNDIEIVRLLLKNGADPMHDNQYYGLPVFMAAEMIPQDYNFNRKGSRDNWVLPGYSEVAAKGISELTILLLGDQSVDIQNGRQGTVLCLERNPNSYPMMIRESSIFSVFSELPFGQSSSVL